MMSRLNLAQTNSKLYLAVLCLIGAVILVGGLGDFILFLCKKPTITDFLRDNPEYFWVPVMVIVGAIVLLAIHLFLIPEIKALWNTVP